MKVDTLIRNCDALVPTEGGHLTIRKACDIFILDGRIESIHDTAELMAGEVPEIIDGRGMLAMSRMVRVGIALGVFSTNENNFPVICISLNMS